MTLDRTRTIASYAETMLSKSQAIELRAMLPTPLPGVARLSDSGRVGYEGIRQLESRILGNKTVESRILVE